MQFACNGYVNEAWFAVIIAKDSDSDSDSDSVYFYVSLLGSNFTQTQTQTQTKWTGGQTEIFLKRGSVLKW